MKYISIFVMTVAFVIFLCWRVDYKLVAWIYPDNVSMKVTAAILFIESGLLLFLIRRKKYHVFIMFLSQLICFSVLQISIAYIDNFTPFFIKVLSVHDQDQMTAVKNVPAITTLIGFFLVGLWGLSKNFGSVYPDLFCLAPFAVVIISLFAISGYILNEPLLFYYVEGKSTGMALSTAVLFMAIGFDMISLDYSEYI